ncbi:ABC transporter ATP-binding protein [Rosenbergiella nectarea]|uniref:ABC transporter ATP-binding protein n=1 Tax=Rosenbergiella nectarea TaxID=988801 RepID=UPI001F4ED2CD|nr:ABC transporter ATP-binding protein [Rosenbergiella nectarea]
MENSIINVRNVSKEFEMHSTFSGGIKNLILNPKLLKSMVNSKTHRALDEVTFSVEQGESVALIGKNGSGKSTLLSLLTGVIKPTSGSITTRGRIAAMLELGGGFHSELTGRENIIMNATLLGQPLKETKNKLESIIEFSELGDFINQPIRTYSSGMLAKLGFSVISHVEPDILIIDEVLAVGDISFQKKCLDVIKNFQKNGTTIILVSHSMTDVKNFCERSIWVKDHRIALDSQSEIVIDAYKEYMLNG